MSVVELQTNARQYCNAQCMTTIASTLSYQGENDVPCHRQVAMLQGEKMAAEGMSFRQNVMMLKRRSPHRIFMH